MCFRASLENNQSAKYIVSIVTSTSWREVEYTFLMELTTAERNWLAGIFEGEGTCGLYGPYAPKKDKKVILSLTSTDEDVITTIHRLTRVGTIALKRLSAKNPNHRDQWNWQVQDIASVLAVCSQLYPLLHSRRQAQMQPVMVWCEERLTRPLRPGTSNPERDRAGRYLRASAERLDGGAA